MTQMRTLKVISLNPNLALVNTTKPIKLDDSTEEEMEEVIVAPFLLDKEQAIEDISELVDTVYQKFSEACEKKDLNWEAELELGLEFGVTFLAKLKISPK